MFGSVKTLARSSRGEGFFLAAEHLRLATPSHNHPSGDTTMQALQEPVTNGSIDTTSLLHALAALEKGDFSVRLPMEWTGVTGKVADTFNRVVELNQRMATELERISRVVGKEG